MRRFLGIQSGFWVLPILVICLAPLNTLATPVLTFYKNNTTTAGGTVFYDGTSNGVLTGGNIELDNIVGTGTAANDGTILTCVSCVLDFTTGPVSVVGNPYTFSTGGIFDIAGTVEDASDNVIASGILVTGEFTSNVYTSFVTNTTPPPPTLFYINGTGSDTKNADLLNYFGITASDNFDFANITIGIPTGGTAGAFTGDVYYAQVTNTDVPEPNSLFLLTSGLVAFVAVRKIKLNSLGHERFVRR